VATEYENPFDDAPEAEDLPLIEAAKAQQGAGLSAIAETTVSPKPDLNDLAPNPNIVSLPGGVVIEGVEVNVAEVRELTGEDEEALFKSSNNFYRFISVILERGVSRVGDEPATPALLKKLLIGDRDTLLLGIRRATFGDEIEIKGVVCPWCDVFIGDLTIALDTVEIKELDGKPGATYDVTLRDGRVAVVTLPTGADQSAVFANDKLSAAAQNTLLLSRVVKSIGGGKVTEKTVRTLGILDRKTLLQFLADAQPGPRYDDIVTLHEDCNNEIPVPLTVMEMFRGLF
jgi:hypothetical protein